ncbi:MAG TPA: lyase family protein [Candidatus Dojkabacteria bacterium]
MKKYYSKETTQALENFPLSTHIVYIELIHAVTKVKKATAEANYKDGGIDKKIKNAITDACDEILTGKFDDQFQTAAIQGGAGTSINMNVNEVIAGIASEKSGIRVHPNDHINKSQSTNDANPTSLKILMYGMLKSVVKSGDLLVASFDKKAKEFKKIMKLGRTHIQDAVPITLGDEFDSYKEIIKRGVLRIKESEKYLFDLNIGGTAVGNGINATDIFRKSVIEEIQKITKEKRFKLAKSLMSQTSSQTDILFVADTIKTLFVDLSKIAGDLRLLSSGPNGGLGEIRLKPLQAGSSIMPGKVNPVIPEYMNQVYYYVSGKRMSIEHAAHTSNLELGIMFPVIADSIISIMRIATDSLETFAVKCIDSIEANEKNCRENLEKSTAFATLLTPKFGYDMVSKVVKESLKSGKSIREIFIEKKILTNEEFDNMTRL